MTKIRPFRAVVYNPEKVNLSSVVCPPYDVISPSRQEYFHGLNSYNFIHILLGKDIPGDDKYRRAANYFREWMEDKIFIQEEKPAVYFYSQQFNLKGEKRTRLGFISLLHLGEQGSPVFGHENTRLEPKEDRSRLLRAVKANLSPIFVVFADRERIIQYIYEKEIQNKKPFMEVKDDEKTVHKLWRVDSPEILARMQSKMASENIFIADGHHRYEVACAYRDQMRQKLGKTSGEEDFNYVLAYFTNTGSRDLVILPIHRLVKLTSGAEASKFLSSITEYFDVEEVKDRVRFFFLMEKAGMTEHIIGMYRDGRYRLLRLKNIKILDKVIKDKPPEYRSLDVSILNLAVLRAILGPQADTSERLTFSNDAEELIEKVDSNSSYLAFFLNPVKIKQITAIALAGEKMPAKSTYFYPKVLSGLVINKHEDI